jgi:hypothetical protein
LSTIRHQTPVLEGSGDEHLVAKPLIREGTLFALQTAGKTGPELALLSFENSRLLRG